MGGREKENPALDRVFSLFGGDALRQAIAWVNYGFLAENFFAVHQRSCLVRWESLGFVAISVPKRPSPQLSTLCMSSCVMRRKTAPKGPTAKRLKGRWIQP
jgi:hypothetical protein